MGIGTEPHTAIGKRGDLRRRLRLYHGDVRRIEAKAQPAIKQSATHLPGPDQYEAAGQMTQIGAVSGGRI